MQSKIEDGLFFVSWFPNFFWNSGEKLASDNKAYILQNIGLDDIRYLTFMGLQINECIDFYSSASKQ